MSGERLWSYYEIIKNSIRLKVSFCKCRGNSKGKGRFCLDSFSSPEVNNEFSMLLVQQVTEWPTIKPKMTKVSQSQSAKAIIGWRMRL